MKFFRKTAFLALLAVPLAAASLQMAKPEDVGISSERLQRIHQMILRHIEAKDISGAVTLVARQGRVVHLEAHGLMDFESKKPMVKDAIFRMASMSKPVTSVAIMMLLEEGKLRLTDPVSKFIPAFKNIKVAIAQPDNSKAPPDYLVQAHPELAIVERPKAPTFYTVPANREITIRDLLTHVSGLVSGPMSHSAETKIARQPNETLASYIPRLASTPLEFQPGSQWLYSGQAGFDVLGRIVEIVSGQGYDQFLRLRIFEPLGMNETFFYPPDSLLPRLATAYDKLQKGVELLRNPNYFSSTTYFAGSSGLMSTAQDYAQFALMLANGGEWNGKRLLSPKTVALMSAIHVPDTMPGRVAGEGFGLGVRVIQDSVAGDFRLSNGSFGWSGAFGTHFWVDPKEKLVAILMIQTRFFEMKEDFENAVMQSIIE